MNQYIDFYNEVRETIAARSCAEMNACREDAFRTFSSQGFPSKKVERYRYANVEADFSPNYGINTLPNLETKFVGAVAALLLPHRGCRPSRARNI